MTRSFEYTSYNNADQLTMCETLAADDEGASGQPTPGDGGAEGAGLGPHAPDGRTEALINRGRAPAGRSRTRWLRSHLGPIAIAGGGGGGPGGGAQVQAEITTACENPNVAAEPSQLNFACAKSTQPILWVFAL